ncbi:MAG: HAMP domain-containing histidine kinase [Bacteroidales bacterium]|nr:HAMP domain-containing histidine kinase [Bacteroidales bacterium]
MKKRHINLIITITTISLLGIVFTQLYWVKKAVDLKDEQFNASVRMALKSVANQLLDYHNDSTIRQIQEFGPECIIEKTNIRDLINFSFLDSLMQEEMGCMKINRDYEYAVINYLNDRFVMGKYAEYEPELLRSKHKVSLKALYRPGEYWLVVYFPYQKSMILSQMIVWVILSALFLVVVIFTFSFTIYSFIRQKKLSEMKSDFVNNMTHEFKTPISTISLASEMLLKPFVFKSSEKTKKYAHVIFDENTRLQNQVERVLQIAILDKGEAKIRKKELDIHKVISKIVANFNLVVSKRGGKVLFKPNAKDHIIVADKVHFSSIIANLIDNANKYTPENPKIIISTEDFRDGVKIFVEDNGIGISPENQKQVFKKLYRVPTGNLHDVKGFGLGLYYVKTMVEAHEGSIKIHSELGKGSRFELFLPRSNKKNITHEE